MGTSGQGWFAVDRATWDHPAFADEKFSECEVFLWLLSEAAYKSWKVRIGSDVLEIHRGQLSHSLRFMATKWKWPEPRVRRYLERLKQHEIILIEVWSKNGARGDARQTVITICNYEKYQSPIHERSILIGRFVRHEQMDGSTIAALGRNIGHSYDRITRRALPQDEPRSRQPTRRC